MDRHIQTRYRSLSRDGHGIGDDSHIPLGAGTDDIAGGFQGHLAPRGEALAHREQVGRLGEEPLLARAVPGGIFLVRRVVGDAQHVKQSGVDEECDVTGYIGMGSRRTGEVRLIDDVGLCLRGGYSSVDDADKRLRLGKVKLDDDLLKALGIENRSPFFIHQRPLKLCRDVRIDGRDLGQQ